ncbi:tyrosine-type recombinase/integrase [Halanaeroarchaeum sp. HSR-CO]|uniref:tyrosine-type recombinase/integrase n=1 Tax=Halanaeroarchaeum sp. HSR-CO TaxID=2866382 RepID=UPI00217D0A27|nr:tyrosine-type recombinase/integrase [Halanaeroarchaeum sp. HSR-CO]
MTNSEVAWLKPDQVEAMRDVAHQGRNGHRDEALVTLLYDTGLRRAEAAAIDRDMLDLDDGTLFVPGPIQKDYPNDNSPPPVTMELDQSGDLRTVRSLRAFISSRTDTSIALWPGRSTDRLSPKAINNVVKRLAERADVRPHLQVGQGEPDDVSAHTLRHSVAYRMLRIEGKDIYAVKGRLRHASLSTTDRKYAHLDTV